MMRLEWSIFRRRSLPAPSFRAGRTITVVTVSVISLKAAFMVPFIAVVAIVVIFVEAASMAPFVVVSVKFSSVIHLTVDDYYLRGFGFISISV